MGVVETMVWIAAALAASVLAVGVFLLMATVGAAMLLAGMASNAVRSIFGRTPGSRVTYQRRSPERRDFPEQRNFPEDGARSPILEGEVLRRSE